ncbi:hypothetical protein Dimus_017888 [Dionaea muscipula]
MPLIPKKFACNSSHCVNFYSFNIIHISQIKNPNLHFSTPPIRSLTPPQLQSLMDCRKYPASKSTNSLQKKIGQLRIYQSDGSVREIDGFSGSNFDAFLSITELACLVSSVAISAGCMVIWVFFRQQNVNLVAMGNRVLVWLLAGALAVGTVIRRRQWRRVGGVSAESGVQGGNIVERIEKLEENLRSATTIVRMLSRQLEKLGIRFRVTKKALKEPIDQTTALAQKNFEATRELALQADILEKELTEVQKILLAMQEQQQKQLELILAIAKAGRLFEANQGSDAHATEKSTDGDGRLKQVDSSRIQTAAGQQKGTNNKL